MILLAGIYYPEEYIILIILYFQFKSTSTSLLVFSGIIVAWSGRFGSDARYSCFSHANIVLYDLALAELSKSRLVHREQGISK